jgi:exosome complex RNA-binding protein Rrp4
MKQLLSVIALVLAISAGAVAHEGNDHVRGVVTAVSAQSVTVELADKTTKTLTLSARTALEASGKAAKLADLKVGDRVVIDVPEHTMSAVLIKVGAKK